MDKKQKIYLTTAAIFTITGQLLTVFYRPYIYQNKLNDFGFADTIGSLVSVISVCCLFWSLKKYSNKEMNKQILIGTLIYTVIWEPMGLFGIHGTFDWKDIVAVVISGIIAYLTKELVERNIKIVSTIKTPKE